MFLSVIDIAGELGGGLPHPTPGRDKSGPTDLASLAFFMLHWEFMVEPRTPNATYVFAVALARPWLDRGDPCGRPGSVELLCFGRAFQCSS